jgi:hypothetical protein
MVAKEVEDSIISFVDVLRLFKSGDSVCWADSVLGGLVGYTVGPTVLPRS